MCLALFQAPNYIHSSTSSTMNVPHPQSLPCEIPWLHVQPGPRVDQSITFALGQSSFWWTRSLALSMVAPHRLHVVLECGHLPRCSVLSEYVPCQSQPELGHFILRLLICSLTALSGKVLLNVISVRSMGQRLLRDLMTGVIHFKQNLCPQGVCGGRHSIHHCYHKPVSIGTYLERVFQNTQTYCTLEVFVDFIYEHIFWFIVRSRI